MEILIVDGGSQDNTLAIVSQFSRRNKIAVKVIKNSLMTGEAGKAKGVKTAVNEILAFIDSDNVLPGRRWLQKMVVPFEKTEIVASEPLYYTYRKEDSYIDRYCSLMGMNDPLCFFFGNYDRHNLLTGKWTEGSVKVKDADGFLHVVVDGEVIPTIGANGFLVRKRILLDLKIKDYLFDVDVVGMLIKTRKRVEIAKVRCGIIHLYCRDFKTFVKKQRRRIVDYYRYGGIERPPIRWDRKKTKGAIRFLMYCISVLPLFWQSFSGYRRKPDGCWIFHPFACWTTLFVYGYASVENVLGRKRKLSRAGWAQ